MATSHFASLTQDYPWISPSTPLITSAPMRLISTVPLTLAVSRAGGIGFLGGGTDVSNLSSLLHEATQFLSSSPIPNVPEKILPIGVGVIVWGASLPSTISAIQNSKLKPAAVWLFAPENSTDLVTWSTEVRKASNNLTKIWIQVGTVQSAFEAARTCNPDVLVVQGSDAGGHGLVQSSSIISFLPEVYDVLKAQGYGHIPLVAAGGIVDGRGTAAAVILGASGISMGTRFLASTEAEISNGYQNAVLHASDGGVSTKRSTVYDRLRGTTGWPSTYDGRGILNDSFFDEQNGMNEAENRRLYEEAVKKGDLGWGKDGKGARMTTYAGTGVGLIREVRRAGEIVNEVAEEAQKFLSRS
ncbi:hypothetical protein BJ875DRAFT_453358 [Amylocarpus encephaloides]|uniref:Nitronate monooxygenase domain-containing protein n=1 Tax=Amylocarpus encephaloides TaxID=45428 RepID=A0A9P8C8D2_9HELO|nr:hypothetical protein BJ875DRAFT_453358 [Amylocarpus encephaloides]